MLPRLPNRDQIKKAQTVQFSGINRNPAAPDGSVFTTENMGSDRMPCLSPRKPRHIVARYSNCNGMFAHNGLYIVLGNRIYKDGKAIGNGTAGEHQPRKFAAFNDPVTNRDFIIMFPDKLIIDPEQIDPTQEDWPTEFSESFSDAAFTANGPTADTWTAILTYGYDWQTSGLRVGDTVTVTGATDPFNNRQATITEIREHELRFAPYTFTSREHQHITVSCGLPTPGGTDAVSAMEVHLSQEPVKFISDDEEISSEYNIMESQRGQDFNWESTGLRVGDALLIDGSDTPVVIRKIRGPRLIFDDNTFLDRTQSTTMSLDISRTVPDLEGIYVHEQRLWGWKGSTIYASKWNDPLNFDVFDGLESDSWAYPMDGTGDICGGIVYQGYPMFFKQDKVVRIYGDRPSQYRAMDVSIIGINPNCGETLAVAGDALYYVSRNGMAVYRGGYSQNIHAPFGEAVFTQGKASSDGRRYYLSTNGAGIPANLVYDTVYDCWFGEDYDPCQFFACDRGNLYCMTSNGILWLDGHANDVPSYATPEGTIESYVEFGDFTGNYWTAGRGYGNPSRKGTSKIQLRLTMDAGTELEVYIWFDGDSGNPITVATLKAEGKRSYYLPIIPRRSDHYRIAIRARGDWTLNSLVREEYSGSDIH